MSSTTSPEALTPAGFRVSPEQLEFFRTFGFLKFPGLFKNEIESLREAFDEAFATREPNKVIREDPLQETDTVFKDRKRVILFHIVEQSEKLRWLHSDPRILNIVTSIMGDKYEARPTDGHVFDCDTSWHPDQDFGGDGRFRLKLSFYLDAQRHNSGAIRVIPGSQFKTEFAETLLRNLYGSPHKVKAVLGVDASEIPCWTVESDPGDLVCWNFRTFHATFHGFQQRRLFSMTFAELPQTV